MVDDEADLREIICDELQFEGAIVDTANSVAEALLKIESNPYELILSDMRMPGGDGRDLVHQVRQKYGLSSRIILLTGFADLKIEEAYNIGAEGYVCKPYHLNDLKKLIQRILNPKDINAWPDSMGRETVLSIDLNFSKAFESYQIHWGRGGFSINFSRQVQISSEILRLRFPDGDLVGLWRWSQKSKDGTNCRHGIEVLSCDPVILEILNQSQPNWNQVIPYIPL